MNNNFKLKILTALIGCSCACFSAKSQGNKHYPEIGKTCPDFKIKKVSGKREEISSTSLKGKHFILDFWSTGCVPCIGSLPEVNELRNRFKDKVEFILIGLDEKNRDVHAFYKKFEKKFNLNLTCGIDSIVFKRFVHGVVPFTVWVDDDGIVRVITNGEAVKENNISRFLAGERFEFSDLSFANDPAGHQTPLSNTTSTIEPKYGDTIVQSAISKWRPGTAYRTSGSINGKTLKEGTIRINKLDLTALYNMAYFGSEDYIQNKYYPVPILSVKDSTLFKYKYDNTAEQKFNYVLSMHNAKLSKQIIMEAMQNDLKRAFPYNVRIVQAQMPCMQMVVIDINKLNKAIRDSKGREMPFDWKIEAKSNSINKYPVKNLASLFAEYMPFPLKSRSYDKTGVNDGLTIKFEGDIDSLENIRTQLNKIGLDYISTTELTSVLQITE